MQHLRRIARKPAGTVKPQCSRDRPNVQGNSFEWRGELLTWTTSTGKTMYKLNDISLCLQLDGDIIKCNLHVALDKELKLALYKDADTAKLESLVGALREIALWI